MAQPESHPSRIGERLSEIREGLRFSQADFASELGISLRAYQSYERTERELPFSVAIELYRKFQVNPIWLALGIEGGSRRALSPEDAAALCSELYESWEKALSAFTPTVPYEVKRPLYRKLARATFRAAKVPNDEVAETVRDLKV
jgi:transcriptional regulator with XRE-family HTH domain